MKWNLKASLARKRIQAFSLIEISVSLLIVGMITSSSWFLFRAGRSYYRSYVTQQKHDFLIKAICVFGNQKFLLPLPAADQSGLAQEPKQNFNEIQTCGFVPWKTLKISQNASLDAAGKPIKYVVHPGLVPEKDEEVSRTTEAIARTFADSERKVNLQNHNFITVTKQGESICEMDKDDFMQNFKVVGAYYHCPKTIHMPENVELGEGAVTLQADRGTAKHHFSIFPSYFNNRIVVDSVQGRPKIKKAPEVFDCIAFALVSGDDGLSNKPYQEGKVYELEQKKGVLVSYVTRLNAALFGGPRCSPVLFNKSRLLHIQKQPSDVVDKITKDKDFIVTTFVYLPETVTEKEATGDAGR